MEEDYPGDIGRYQIQIPKTFSLLNINSHKWARDCKSGKTRILMDCLIRDDIDDEDQEDDYVNLNFKVVKSNMVEMTNDRTGVVTIGIDSLARCSNSMAMFYKYAEHHLPECLIKDVCEIAAGESQPIQNSNIIQSTQRTSKIRPNQGK